MANEFNCSATLAGMPLDCGNVGGLKKVYVAKISDVSAISEASGEITAITMNASAKFLEYSFKRGNATYTVEGTKDDKAGTYFTTAKVALQFNRMDKDKRNEIVKLIATNAYVIVQDNNDIYWFLGKDSYVSCTTASGQSGSTMGEGNFFNIELSTESPTLPYTVASGIVNALVTEVP